MTKEEAESSFGILKGKGYGDKWKIKKLN